MSFVESHHRSSRVAPFGAIAVSTALHVGVALGTLFAAPTGVSSPLVWIDVARVAVATDLPAPEPPAPEPRAPEPPAPEPPALAPPKPTPLARPIADAPQPPADEPPPPAAPPPQGPSGASSAGPGPDLVGASGSGSGVASIDGGAGLGGSGTPGTSTGTANPAPAPAPTPAIAKAPLCPRPRVGYPAEARRRSLEGEVTARLVVLEDGRVGEATIVRSAGPTLDEAVLAVVRAMRCEPGRIGGLPVSSPLPYTVRFVLEDP